MYSSSLGFEVEDEDKKNIEYVRYNLRPFSNLLSRSPAHRRLLCCSDFDRSPYNSWLDTSDSELRQIIEIASDYHQRQGWRFTYENSFESFLRFVTNELLNHVKGSCFYVGCRGV